MNETIPSLDRALAALNDKELDVLIARMGGLSQSFFDSGDMRVSDLFASLTVLAAEQQDRRRELAEHARIQLDGDTIGGLLAEWADRPDFDD